MMTLVLAFSFVLANQKLFEEVRNSVDGDEIQGVINALERISGLEHFSYKFHEYLGHDDYGFLFSVSTRDWPPILMQVLYTLNNPEVELDTYLKQAPSHSNPFTMQMTGYQFFKSNLAKSGEAEKPAWLIALTFDTISKRLDKPLVSLIDVSDPEEHVISIMDSITKIFDLFKTVSKDSKVNFQKFSIADLFLLPGHEIPQIRLLVPPLDPQTFCKLVVCFVDPSEKKKLMSLSDIETTIYDFVNANKQSLKNTCPTNEEMQNQIIKPIRDQFEQLRESDPSFFSSVSTFSGESDNGDAAPGNANEQEFAEEFSSNDYTELENTLIHNRILI
jgi:hypothetical protein